MRPEVAQRRIQSFRARFGEAHFLLATHAAFPLALTSDLLYHLWANFQQDIRGEVLNIPWLAVSDLLLSSLCDEVGHELYEMPQEVRNNLLIELKTNPCFGVQRINELSDFLLTHVKQQLESHDPDIRDSAQAQQWAVLAYTQPSKLAHELTVALSKLGRDDRTEWIRITSLANTFAEPLAEFEPLLSYAYAMEKFVYGDHKGAVEQLVKLREENLLNQDTKSRLPISLLISDQIASLIELAEPSGQALTNSPSLQLPTSNILVVDDSFDNCHLIKQLLEAEGYHVDVTDSGISALSMVETSSPELLILDVVMPGVDGYEVTRRIRQNTKLPYLPILLISAHETASVVKGLDTGADDFIRKPIDFDELLARVRSLLRLKRSIQGFSEKVREPAQRFKTQEQKAKTSTHNKYSIVDLGTLGGTESQAWAINKFGQVVGWSYLENNEIHHAFLWTPEEGMHVLHPSGSMQSAANDINDLGQVVIGTEGGNGQTFLWDKDRVVDLGTLGGSRSFPYSINNLGQVVGYSTTHDDTESHAFLWEVGTMIDLGTFPENVQSIALDVNGLGQVTGEGRVIHNQDSHAFLWTKLEGMVDLGTMNGFQTSRAFGINDLGQIVGYFMYGQAQSHFFLFEGGVMRDLGVGEAYSINNNGQIIGRAGSDGKAFIWSNGITTSLNDLIPSDSGWDLTWARDINDAGQIVGLGKINDQIHAFLMSPNI